MRFRTWCIQHWYRYNSQENLFKSDKFQNEGDDLMTFYEKSTFIFIAQILVAAIFGIMFISLITCTIKNWCERKYRQGRETSESSEDNRRRI